MVLVPSHDGRAGLKSETFLTFMRISNCGCLKGVRYDPENGNRSADICRPRRAGCVHATSYFVRGDGFGEVRGACNALVVNMKYKPIPREGVA